MFIAIIERCLGSRILGKCMERSLFSLVWFISSGEITEGLFGAQFIIPMSLVTVLSPVAGQPLFFLRGAASSYVFGVHACGALCHLHWGKALAPDSAVAGRLHARPLAFSPESVAEKRALRIGYDALRYEYPTANTGDFREPAIDVLHSDGTRGLRLVYAAHRVIPGKPALVDLPATYVENVGEAETVEGELRDAREPTSGGGGGVVVTLSYTVFAGRDVIARSARIENRGAEPVTLTRALSASADLAGNQFDLLTLPGARFAPAGSSSARGADRAAIISIRFSRWWSRARTRRAARSAASISCIAATTTAARKWIS